MESALYLGRVEHRRATPVPHRFVVPLFMVYLDLSELSTVFRGRWFWSTSGSALASFQRRDHFGDPQRPLDETVRNLVEERTGRRPAGPIRLLTHPLGLGMSPRRITVSTVGLISGIRKLGEDFGGKIGLAISLHAPDPETRSRIIPMNEHQPMSELMSALRSYPLPKRRRITIEYTLIEGVNDEVRHARSLAQTLRGLPTKVNLIPMNPIQASELRGPKPAAVDAFRNELARLRVSCSVRQTRGDDVDAACGQLALAATSREA